LTTILVTGANGLLGQKLTLLLDRDPTVRTMATAKGPLTVPLKNGEYFQLDISDAAAVNKVIGTTRPDVVINTAAMTQVDACETDRDGCWKNNVTAVGFLVDACRDVGAHFIQLSTDFVFDGTHGPLDESAVPNPLSHYGASKLAAEEIVTKSNLSWTVIRTVLVYGVSQDQTRSNIVLWVKKSLEEGKAIRVVDDQWRTPTLAEDLAMGCMLAATKKAVGIFHISGSDMMTPYDIAIQTADFFDLDKSLITKTDSTQFRQPAVRPPRTGFIIDKAIRELGFTPHTFAEGLKVVASQVH